MSIENKIFQREKNNLGVEGEITKFPRPKEYIKQLQEQGLDKYAEAYKKVLIFSKLIQEEGGRALLVGGSVRDHILGKVAKDFDLEIYGLASQRVESITHKMGKVSDTGKSFGILKIFLDDGIDIDVSLPRVDSKNGDGHKGFDVKSDPNMSIKEAAKRRDFTVNALAADPLTGELYDYYGGVEDARNRVLKVTDEERFRDDPLRVMRAMQFIGRFGMSISPGDVKLMTEMSTELSHLPKERIGEEWKKLLLKSEKPSLGLLAASSFGILEQLHNELAILELTPQEPQWHPEGDAWMHTMMVVDEAAKIVRRNNLNGKEAITILLGALCHDLGKPIVTKYIDGKFRSLGHEGAGAEPTKKFLLNLGIDKVTIQKVVKIVENHLAPTTFYINEVIKGGSISDGAIRRLAKRIHPATIQELVLVAKADHLGRGEFDVEIKEQLLLADDEFPAADWLLERARNLKVEDSRPADLTRGKDWISFGYGPGGPHIGQLIQMSNELRDEKNLSRPEVFALVDGIDSYEEALQKMQETLDK